MSQVFDAVTAELLRSAPSLEGLSSDELPAQLARTYAQLTAHRLALSGKSPELDLGGWDIATIADCYELIALTTDDAAVRKSSAFVAATSRQLLTLADGGGPPIDMAILSRDSLHPAASAVLLFLIAEQFADANEAAARLRALDATGSMELLRNGIVGLGSGDLEPVLVDAIERASALTPQGESLASQAESALSNELVRAIGQFASELLGSDRVERKSAGQIVDDVLALASAEVRIYEHDRLTSSFPGHHQLARLLSRAFDALRRIAVIDIPPPNGAESAAWSAWLSRRAQVMPYVWPNHVDLLFRNGFQDRGKSAVLVLPTGAGKTSVVAMKIAAVLQAGQNVVFLAPTHALVEQLTEELGREFEDVAGLSSNPLDSLFVSVQLARLEVMTPERCLALLSFSPEAFENLGLLVFDECHLLSPASGARRSIDAMFSLLRIAELAPWADWVLLSAMLKNGSELAAWVSSVTGRPCLFEESLWKPARQVRGVVAYSREEIEAAKSRAIEVQNAEDVRRHRRAKTLRVDAAKQLQVQPKAIFGLVHNWLYRNASGQGRARVSTVPLLGSAVQLSGKLDRGQVRLTPNANEVSAAIALGAARAKLKSIVFVNSRPQAVSLAARIASQANRSIKLTQYELNLWDAIIDELGSADLSPVDPFADAVPHHSHLLRHERRLSENLFRRKHGASTIVATPTLAQGLNLPAHVAILAGDRRMNPDTGVRTELEAHEILNAAARAGRAGHLANGIVLLVPDPYVAVQDGRLESNLVQKLQAVLPEDDRCIQVTDPLTGVLDAFAAGQINTDAYYGLNRLVVTRGERAPALDEAALRRSLGYFRAVQAGEIQDVESKIAGLARGVDAIDWSSNSRLALVVSAQTGLSPQTVSRVEAFARTLEGRVPTTPVGWTTVTFGMLATNADVLRDVAGADIEHLEKLVTPNSVSEGLLAAYRGSLKWIQGDTFLEIEAAIRQCEPTEVASADLARKLVLTILPRTVSYSMQLLVSMAQEVLDWSSPYEQAVAEAAVTCLQKGFDSPAKLAFSTTIPSNPTRRQALRMYFESPASGVTFSPLDDYQAILSQVRSLVSD